MNLNGHEGYSLYIPFARQVTLTSPIKLLFTFTGAFVEMFWYLGKYEYLEREGALWNGRQKELIHYLGREAIK